MTQTSYFCYVLVLDPNFNENVLQQRGLDKRLWARFLLVSTF